MFPLFPDDGPTIVKEKYPDNNGNKDKHIEKNRNRAFIKTLCHGNRQIGMHDLFGADSV